MSKARNLEVGYVLLVQYIQFAGQRDKEVCGYEYVLLIYFSPTHLNVCNHHWITVVLKKKVVIISSIRYYKPCCYL